MLRRPAVHLFAAALLTFLTGCGGAGGPAVAPSPLAPDPSPPARSMAAASAKPSPRPSTEAVKAALAAVDAANAALLQDFAWVNAALSDRESLRTDPAKLSLFTEQRRALTSAKSQARVAARRARAAAQESPRDCAVVRGAKAELRRAAVRGEEAFQRLSAAVAAARASLNRAEEHRRRRDSAISALRRAAQQHSGASTAIDIGHLSATAFPVEEQERLRKALDEAARWAHGERAAVAQIVNWARLIAPGCG